MLGNLNLIQLQQLWWILASVVGSLFLFLTFVQGGQTLLFSVARNELEKSIIINSLGRKWELTFTTLVLFGGALFAAFPLFYATSFGGAYWVWLSILFTFVIQAVSYEYRKKPGNVLGPRIYELFLFVNGSIGILLIGAAVGTFFTGANFQLNDYNFVTWQHPLRGLEAAFNPFNICFGLFLVFLARVLGAMYLTNHIDYSNPVLRDMEKRMRQAAITNLLLALPFLLYILFSLATMEGFSIEPATGRVFMEQGKYLHNLLAMPIAIVLLVGGLVLVVGGVMIVSFSRMKSGIWFGGPGTVLTGLAVFFMAGFNNTPFYPSTFDLQSSLSIANASSSHYTLTAMTYVALAIPFVLAYIAYCWRLMDARKLSSGEISDFQAKDLY
jgi:cytochrome d ubiquinol oxidase subunit II